MKILDTQIFKSDWKNLRWMHRFEDNCEVHFSTEGKISEAVVTWGSNPACGDKNHRRTRYVKRMG